MTLSTKRIIILWVTVVLLCGCGKRPVFDGIKDELVKFNISKSTLEIVAFHTPSKGWVKVDPNASTPVVPIVAIERLKDSLKNE